MSITISTHNGSTVARQHNIRNRQVVEKESHIDLDGVHEVWIDEAPRDAYERIFGKAVADYNEKQKREDRKIHDYYREVCQDKRRNPVYEMIIGIYGEEVDDEIGKEIMRKFVDTWKERNPNLELIGAYYHADEEGQPHVHIDYVPIAHGYKRGMHTQAGLDKALIEQGFETKNAKCTAQISWEHSENAFLEKLCNERGLDVSHPQKDKGAEHLKTEIYKLRQQIASLLKYKDASKKELDETKAALNALNREATETLRKFQIFKDKIDNSKKDALSDLDMIKSAMKNMEANISLLKQEFLTLSEREDCEASIERSQKTIDRYMRKLSNELAEFDDEYER